MSTRSTTMPLRARIPGYGALRAKAATALRGSPLARRVAYAVVGLDREGTQGTPMGFRPGRYFTDVEARHLPVVVIVVIGFEGDATERLAREIESAQMLTGSFRPLFVIDTPHFGPFRSRGFAVERVMRAEELAAANPLDSYGDYLFDRVRSIARDYGASSVVPVPAEAADSMRGLTARLVGAMPA
ncbi:hypothetical protein G1H11_02045 [Phytoactinopolyspora alkaliphila]|uniref:Uncharacterized protein n=1 Tax=Phytoactinopolyspora alkaliphila TaxID=1783498 RepID=A0A6N9YGP4_9ACTN|nr:hypothetical protein [Phytoactinopolyspora alkaliphila]NED94085.1 hypothetical protein [Phytoactinopolyspora alkaliphila]